MDQPGPHPEPLSDLASHHPQIFSTGQEWFRIHRIGQEPIYFGRSKGNRFDAPSGEYGVLYLAQNEHCAFIETFGQSTGMNIVTASFMSAVGLALIKTERDLNLIDLVNTGGLARIGADGRLCDGDHSVSRRWSKALHDHPSRPDGLYYRARHDPALTACALYDHAASAITAIKCGSLRDAKNANLVADMLTRYQFSLIID
jgi:hypothetical protein